jgi:hypothetical protein
MPVRKYLVNLSGEERCALEVIIQNEAPRNHWVKHVQILLASD